MNNTYHFIGIGGIGMSAIAKILLEKKNKVKGSDAKSNYVIEELKKNGVQIQIGHDEKNIDSNDTIVISTAIQEDNTEYLKAKKLNLKILHRSDILNELMQGSKPILVTGTHGKTTTTSLLSEVFLESKKDPSFVVGGILNSSKTNGHFGNGEYFIAEADESDGSFLKTKAFAAIVTNLEKEHLNYWKTFENLKKGFREFFSNVLNKQYLFWCIDDENLKNINPDGISYGFSENANLRIENIRKCNFQTIFDIVFFSKTFKDIKINLIGNHNVLNAAAVFGLCTQLNIDETFIRNSFERFINTARRLEKIANYQETMFFDDYAHHPTEIKCTLKALRDQIKEKRLVCVFQPHRYSRLKDLLDGFVGAFDVVDELIVTDIYSAGEKPLKNINEKMLVKSIRRRDVIVNHVPDLFLEDYLLNTVSSFDVVIALGAGDISSKIRNISANYSKNAKKLKVAILYGGRSNEHEISIKSARNYSQAFDKTLFDLKFFKITKDGNWIFQNDDMSVKRNSKDMFSPKILKELKSCDVCFPVFHGPMGEDGMIGAFLDTLDIPYMGCDYNTSGIAMDKAFSKFIVKSHGLLTSNFVEVLEIDWKENKDNICLNVLKKLSFPLYIKPNHLGSSIGIKYVEGEKDLKESIDYVFKYDTSLIIEERIVGIEVQAAVIGNDHIIVGEIGGFLSENQFFDYESKYEKSSMISKLPLELSQDKIQQIQTAAKMIYKVLKLNGFSRVDFFLDDNQNLYFNEVNPIPGYSSNLSMFPRMLDYIGITNKNMINNFVVYALHRNRKNKRFEIAKA